MVLVQLSLGGCRRGDAFGRWSERALRGGARKSDRAKAVLIVVCFKMGGSLKMGVPHNGCFIGGTPMNMDDDWG